MSTPISVNGRIVVIVKRTITYADVELLTLIQSPSVAYKFRKTGAQGSMLDGDHLAVATDLEITAVHRARPS